MEACREHILNTFNVQQQSLTRGHDVPFFGKENCHHLAEVPLEGVYFICASTVSLFIHQTLSLSYVHSTPPPVTLLSIQVMVG